MEQIKKIEIAVKLASLSDIMFDRFIDYSLEKRPPEQKFYLMDENVLALPAENLSAFLVGQFPAGCAMTFEKKKWNDYSRIILGQLFFSPSLIPFLDAKGEKIRFGNFKDGHLRVDRSSPRVKNGRLSIKQEAKERPVLLHPWVLSFSIIMLENLLIDGTKLLNWFSNGGLLIGLGTWRPRYGRFFVEKWEEK